MQPEPPPTRRRVPRERGAALIIVFWLIAVLSLAIFTCVKVIRNDTEIMIAQKKAFRATQLAEMGIAIGANPTVQETDFALLNQTFDSDEGFSVKLRGEGAKFNINAILQSGDLDLLQHIFMTWGVEEEVAIEITDALIDWVDADDLEELHGAENEAYTEMGFPNYPFNRPFYSVEEMRYVRGMPLVILLKPNWRDYFTIFSAGKLDVNETTAELIALSTGLTFETAIEDAARIVEIRLGPDLLEDTQDDYQFRSLGEVTAMLEARGTELVPDPQAVLTQRLTTSDTTTRIESTGRVGSFQKKIVVVVRNRNNRPEVLTREEVPLF